CRMTVVAVGSITGSPGATRFVLGLAAAWPDERRRVVVEADADGGRLGAELGVGVEPGLMALALAARSPGLIGDDLVVRRAGGPGGVGACSLAAAPRGAARPGSAVAHAAASLAAVMAADPSTAWLVDGGRLSARSPTMPFARAADHVVVVSGGTFPLLQLVP